MRCAQCKKKLEDGSEAYIQDWNVIEVGGQTVKKRIKQRIVCADCA